MRQHIYLDYDDISEAIAYWLKQTKNIDVGKTPCYMYESLITDREMCVAIGGVSDA